jgi:hypothetical protein
LENSHDIKRSGCDFWHAKAINARILLYPFALSPHLPISICYNEHTGEAVKHHSSLVTRHSREQAIPTIYAIGFTQLALAEFIALLRGAGVDVLIDTRLRNTSQLAGWAKPDDLAFLLREGFGIAFEHIESFAPTGELLHGYRASHDWDTYAAAYRALLIQREAAATGRALLAHFRAPCLLCSEPTPDRCHRRLLAEYLAEELGGIVTTHLLGARALKQASRRKHA